jgi:hypothetical protein
MEASRHDGPTEPKRIARLLRGYREGTEDELPIGGYATLVGVFGLLFGGLVAGLSRERLLARSTSLSDVALFGVATHKLTRILTRDWVTIPLRAPFTHYEGSDGAGEVNETSRGHGLRRALGDLARCQFCTGPWVASTLLGASLVKPRATRFVATTLAVVTLSDFLHHLYARTKKLSQ